MWVPEDMMTGSSSVFLRTALSSTGSAQVSEQADPLTSNSSLKEKKSSWSSADWRKILESGVVAGVQAPPTASQGSVKAQCQAPWRPPELALWHF